VLAGGQKIGETSAGLGTKFRTTEADSIEADRKRTITDRELRVGRG
jgi:hypothetical protein